MMTNREYIFRSKILLKQREVEDCYYDLAIVLVSKEV